MIDKVDILTKAMQFRKELGEDSNSPIDIFTMAQDMEYLTIVFYPMGDNLSGMCIKDDNKNCVIAINSTMTLGRQRFSLAHEFYHMRFDNSSFSVCNKSIGNGEDIEKEADMFASYLLIPAVELESKVTSLINSHDDGKLVLDDVIRLEQYFRVSHKAMVIRLKESKFITNQQLNNFLTQSVKKKATIMGYSPDLYCSLSAEMQYKTYGHYINQANQLLQSNLISDGKYEELLLTAFRPDLVFGENEDGDIID